GLSDLRSARQVGQQIVERLHGPGINGHDDVPPEAYWLTIEDGVTITATHTGLFRWTPRYDISHQRTALGGLESHGCSQVRRQRYATDPQPGVLVGLGLNQDRHHLLHDHRGNGKADTDRHP